MADLSSRVHNGVHQQECSPSLYGVLVQLLRIGKIGGAIRASLPARMQLRSDMVRTWRKVIIELWFVK